MKPIETRLYTYLLDIDGNADQQTDQTHYDISYSRVHNLYVRNKGTPENTGVIYIL